MLKMQFYFLINRVSVLFLGLTTLLLLGAYLYSSRFYEGFAYLDLYRENMRADYMREAINITKMVVVSTGLFLNIHCFWAGNSKYSAFFIGNRQERIRFISAKLGMITLVILLITVHAWMVFSIVGAWLTPYYVWNWNDAAIFLWIGCEALILGFAEAFLMQFLDSIFTGIVFLGLYWFMELNVPETSKISDGFNIFYQFIPHVFEGKNGFSVFGDLQVYGMILVLIFSANVLLYCIRDIK